MTAVLAVVAFTDPVRAACTFAPQDALLKFSAYARIARDQLFREECSGSDKELVSYDDPRIADRFRKPSGPRTAPGGVYPDSARRLGFEGQSVAALIIETDGSVRTARIIQSSGHEILDFAASRWLSTMRFTVPGALDGQPARVLVVMPINFRLTGKDDLRLPAVFTDAVLKDIADRIVRPFNDGDPAALYAQLADEAHAKLAEKDFIERLSTNMRNVGALYEVHYAGLRRAQRNGDAVWYDLAYVVQTTKSRPTMFLLVSVVTRPRDAAIMDLRIQSSP